MAILMLPDGTRVGPFDTRTLVKEGEFDEQEIELDQEQKRKELTSEETGHAT